MSFQAFKLLLWVWNDPNKTSSSITDCARTMFGFLSCTVDIECARIPMLQTRQDTKLQQAHAYNKVSWPFHSSLDLIPASRPAAPSLLWHHQVESKAIQIMSCDCHVTWVHTAAIFRTVPQLHTIVFDFLLTGAEVGFMSFASTFRKWCGSTLILSSAQISYRQHSC